MASAATLSEPNFSDNLSRVLTAKGFRHCRLPYQAPISKYNGGNINMEIRPELAALGMTKVRKLELASQIAVLIRRHVATATVLDPRDLLENDV
jgi:hypothetical protein